MKPNQEEEEEEEENERSMLEEAIEASSQALIPVGVPWAHPVRGASQVYLGFTSFLTPGGVPVRFTFDIGELRVPPLTNTLPW